MEVKGQVHPAGRCRSLVGGGALWPRMCASDLDLRLHLAREVQLTVNYVEFSRQLFLFSPLSSLNIALGSAAFYFSK
jgi:hypothetical protein